MTLPNCFCWTRFGSEAGQSINAILERKESERRANLGTFLWGIGNSVLPSLDALLRFEHLPTVVFSPTKSKPREVDQAPEKIAIWTSARTAWGESFPLPEGSMVTSHAMNSKPRRHFALVCHSECPIEIKEREETLRFEDLTNLRTGNPIGASQVTAIVRNTASQNSVSREYTVSMVHPLVWPYIIALEDPIVVSTAGVEEAELIDLCWSVRNKHMASGGRLHQLSLQV